MKPDHLHLKGDRSFQIAWGIWPLQPRRDARSAGRFGKQRDGACSSMHSAGALQHAQLQLHGDVQLKCAQVGKSHVYHSHSPKCESFSQGRTAIQLLSCTSQARRHQPRLPWIQRRPKARNTTRGATMKHMSCSRMRPPDLTALSRGLYFLGRL